MIKTALITGASGGIGYEFAKLFAARKCDLVLVARNREKLEEIKTELEEKYLIRVFPIAKDLTEDGAVKDIHQRLAVLGISVDYLVNNAGFGDNRAFLDAPWEIHQNMLKLNVSVLMDMSYLFGKDMLKKGHGRILNISSIAAFSPGPFMSVYYASKAYVLSFSEAIAEELRGTGVTVTAFCPGPTETAFEKTAGLEKSKMFKMIKPATAAAAAKAGFAAMIKGQTVSVHGAGNKALTFLSRFTPRCINRQFAKMANS